MILSIISHIYSGLGNQLFQYAAGRYLSLKFNTDLKLDIGDYAKDTLTSYDLDKFKINATLASEGDLKFYKNRPANTKEKIAYWHWRLTKKPVLIKEQAYHFENELSAAKKNSYLDGHFQSEKYFFSIRSYLLKELTIKEKDKREELSRQLKTTESVAVIIRRGDFLQHDHLNLYGSDLSYYYKAVEKMAGELTNPHFFIFSDDIEWVKNNLVLSYPVTYVSKAYPIKNGYVVNPERHLDLMLMKDCKHQVITNSTYAWWGAWLNENERKLVIAPNLWVKPGHKWTNGEEVQTRDILPAAWIKL